MGGYPLVLDRRISVRHDLLRMYIVPKACYATRSTGRGAQLHSKVCFSSACIQGTPGYCNHFCSPRILERCEIGNM